MNCFLIRGLIPATSGFCRNGGYVPVIHIGQVGRTGRKVRVFDDAQYPVKYHQIARSGKQGKRQKQKRNTNLAVFFDPSITPTGRTANVRQWSNRFGLRDRVGERVFTDCFRANTGGKENGMIALTAFILIIVGLQSGIGQHRSGQS